MDIIDKTLYPRGNFILVGGRSNLSKYVNVFGICSDLNGGPKKDMLKS